MLDRAIDLELLGVSGLVMRGGYPTRVAFKPTTFTPMTESADGEWMVSSRWVKRALAGYLSTRTRMTSTEEHEMSNDPDSTPSEPVPIPEPAEPPPIPPAGPDDDPYPDPIKASRDPDGSEFKVGD